jgi:ATP-dependent Clp protease ATP-binding subunit ClpC
MPNSKQSPIFHVCGACHGQGYLDNQPCPECRGLGVVASFFGQYLYWGKRIDRLNIAVDKTLKTIDLIINVILGLFGFLGFITLVYIASQDGFQSFFSIEYWKTPTWEKLIFWLSLFTDLYLYYRLLKNYAPHKRVFPKIYMKQPLNSGSQDWSTIVNLPKKNFIDASQAFDEEAIEFITRAWSLTKDFEHPLVTRTHLFAVAPQFNQGALMFGRLGINMEKFKEKVGKVLNWKIKEQSRVTEISAPVYKILLNAYFLAYSNNRVKVQLPEVILSLIDTSIFDKAEISPDYVEDILIELELTYQKVFNVVEWIRLQRRLKESLSRFRERARFRSKSGIDRAMTAVITPFLDQYSTDLTQLAKYGQLFPCVGRDKEFEEIFRIIEGSKGGMLLVGNAGVGRSAIIHGLAQRMVEEEVPERLRDKRLVSISVSQLLSGADASVAEERLLTMASEIARAKNIVVVMEDLQGVVGITAGKEGSLDLGDVFAELLKRDLFLALATTTPAQYSKMIEGTNLDSAFKVVKVDELDLNNAIQVLEVKSGSIEYKNNVFFSYDSIEKAAELSQKYIHERYLPDKALDIMEDVAAKVRQEKGDRAVITGEDVAKVISEKTGVQATKVTEKESEKLLNLEEEMHKRVIGQTEAVKMVASSLRRARAEIRDVKRPIANLLFLGPTGVGKTELAKTVAEVYFGQEENMLRYDMSEYQEQSSIERLIGNRDEGGLLTEAVRKKSFTLLLLDEIEKAHPDILNLFLQVMDDGRLTDGLGRTIDFTNTIIIMTSNAGAQVIQDEIKNNTPVERVKERLINEELRQYFRPEFLNRFDGIVVFTPLTMTEVIQIARLMANKVVKNLAGKNITLKITDAAIAELAELGFDPKFGARPLRRVMQERVDDTLANYLLKGEIGRRDTVVLDVGGQLNVEKGETL